MFFFLVNYARQGQATQSSIFAPWVAQKAIDGKKFESTCSITGFQPSPWLRVDLLESYAISTVAISNRGDCCADQTDNAEIRIGDSLENNGNNNPICAVTSNLPVRTTANYSCDEMAGRYVNVVRTGINGHLTLCEVEVYGKEPTKENLALKGTATQANTYSDRVAQKAIDGIKHGPGEAPYCAITGYQLSPWWRLDLLNSCTVNTVVIINREDCCRDQTNGAEIRIGDSLENNGNDNPLCGVFFNIPVNSTVSYSCNGMIGRYVNVVMTGIQSHLSLCEVEVYGTNRRYKGFLRLKFLSSVDVAALSNNILNKLESALSLHISDFKLSWTQLPYKEDLVF
ncbi:uncharacterized protein [Paramisgurnus dabryanus]|uniref:uncharacterized protein n=1 Tax=Paramisgurnus dabryanus TaxID=90735 RepID=UPI003CCF5D4A